MRISLIGMAGAGKSYWARKLQEHGFVRFCCDELIAEKLAPEFAKIGLENKNMGEWMGFPHGLHYKEREQRYLELEQAVVEDILSYLEREAGERDVVVDTTGSFIYLEKHF